MARKGERVGWIGSVVISSFIPNAGPCSVWSVAEPGEPQARIPDYAALHPGYRARETLSQQTATVTDRIERHAILPRDRLDTVETIERALDLVPINHACLLEQMRAPKRILDADVQQRLA